MEKLGPLKDSELLIHPLHGKKENRNKITKKPPQAISVPKEDISAFRLLVEKAISEEEAFQYSIANL